MRFFKAIRGLEWGLASIGAGLCLVAIMLITVISVFGRYVLQEDLIPGAYNIIERIIFPLLVFWALPMAHRDGIFPRLEMIVDALPRRLGRAVGLVVLLVEIVVYAVVLYYVTTFVWAAIETGRSMQVGTDFYPLWPVVIMMPPAFALMILEMVRLLVLDARKLTAGGADEREGSAP